jgi:hypothetical protein
MGEPQGERAVIAEQQGTAAVSVEPADRVEPLTPPQLGRKQIEHGGATLGIVAGGEHPHRFVKEQGEGRRPLAQGPAIDQDPVLAGIGPVAEPGGASIQRNPTLAEQLFGPAPRTNASGGDQLLQTFRSGQLGRAGGV